MAIAWVFPGQGSQKVGMADELLSMGGARERFSLASELLGRDLLAICRGESGGGDGPAELNDTRNTQPALFVVESLLVDSIDGVSIANDNSEAQVVISGQPEAVGKVSEQLKCKRAIPLAVSGAFHSPFMAEAAEQFDAALEGVSFRDARMPVLSNSEPSATSSADVLKQRLKQQMTNGVRWRETMTAMTETGIDTLVEIGPGNVLSGLAKRSMKGVTTAQIAGAADLGQ